MSLEIPRSDIPQHVKYHLGVTLFHLLGTLAGFSAGLLCMLAHLNYFFHLLVSEKIRLASSRPLLNSSLYSSPTRKKKERVREEGQGRNIGRTFRKSMK